MTAAEFELLDAVEAEALITWRFQRLAEAGYEPGQALQLAVTPTADVRGVARLLLQGGLPATTALGVLL